MSQPDLEFRETEVLAEACKKSLAVFVRNFWHIIEAQPLVWAWHLDVFCDEMQAIIERVLRNEDKEYDEVFNVPPGTSKSTVITKMAPVWAWTRAPWFRTIAVSHAQSLALEHARKSRDIVRSELYQQCFPEVGELREDANAKGLYINSKGGMRISTGMRGSIGHHGHLILIDDPMDPLAEFSEAEMTEAKNWISGTLSTRKVDKTKTPTVLVMQRLHVEDPSAHMLEGNSADTPVRHICLPGELYTNPQVEVSPAYLRARYTEDGLLDPLRLPRKALRALLTDTQLGNIGYYAQILQDPKIRGSGMFDVSAMRSGRPPPLSEFSVLIRYWDKAATEEGKATAETAGAKLGRTRANVWWILDMVAGAWETHIRERMIRSTAMIDGYDVEIGVEQEPGSGGKDSAVATVGNLSGYRVRRDRPTGDKIERADPFSVQVNEGNCYIPEGAPWWPKLRAQMAAFPHSKQKDQIDALSGAFSLANKTIKVGAPFQRK